MEREMLEAKRPVRRLVLQSRQEVVEPGQGLMEPGQGLIAVE